MGKCADFRPNKVPILREQSDKQSEKVAEEVEDLPETTREGRTRAGSGRAINLDLVTLS